MQWIKLWSGTPADPKFRLIARDAKVGTAEALGVWIMILEKAGDANGDASGFNPRIADITFDMEDGCAARIITAMQDLGMLDGMRVVKWDERQARAQEKQDVNPNTERSRKWRAQQAMQRNATPCNADATPCNADATPCNGIKEEKRIEEIREEEINTPQPPASGGIETEANPKFSLEEIYRQHGIVYDPASNMEFDQIRGAWSRMLLPEGKYCGLREFYAVIRKGDYPGFVAILQDISARLDAGYWEKGYYPSLARYFSERMWTAEIVARNVKPARKTFAQQSDDAWAGWGKKEKAA